MLERRFTSRSQLNAPWGVAKVPISFAPTTATTVNPNWLFFAAGPNDEEDGLYGYITK